jgi:uncharacterized 2Fe-2S/4Fe-4S cluster protein (DUF4445 family)
LNPQIAYGEDVISRIAYANRSPENRQKLHDCLIITLNQSISNLCQIAKLKTEQIVDAVIVGNTAMHHFLLSLPVSQLGEAPYVPALSDPLTLQNDEIGIDIASGARVFIPPNIAGYIGADHTSALIASREFSKTGSIALLDIGTITEISVWAGDRIVSCSTASGPAFEGAHIHAGMRAAKGAIDHIHLENGQVHFSTVGDGLPIGICGTGILSTISEFLKNGIIDERGAFSGGNPLYLQFLRGDPANLKRRKTEFVLVPAARTGHNQDITISREDIHEIQLAKGAIRAGLEILLQYSGISAQEIDHWLIAGAFGSYLDVESAVFIGLLPENIDPKKVHQVGNAAGVGSQRLLMRKELRTEVDKLAKNVNYLELTGHENFTDMFMDAIFFRGHLSRINPKLSKN